MSETQDSQRVQTAKAFLLSYKALQSSALLTHVSPNFTHCILPTSLGMPSRSRDEFAKHAGAVTSIFTSFAMVPVSIFEDEKKNTVVVHANMVAELVGGMGSYENECVIFLRMDEEGASVVKSTEFVDSWKARGLQEKLMNGKMEKVFE
jgi:hypothetical protein